MNKEDILERSCKENKNKDIVELEATLKACRFAYIDGPIVCIIV